MINFRTKLNSGFSLIELLVVIATLSVLTLGALVVWQKQLAKGRDGRRKADLKKMQTIFEDYLSDAGRYPTAGEISSSSIICEGDFSPYLTQLPCDPSNSGQYHYAYSTNATGSWYKIYAALENQDDDAITESGCEDGCGPGDDYDVFVGSPNVVVCKDPYKPAIGPDGTCTPGVCRVHCPADYVCLPQGDCCRPQLTGECS